MILLSLRAVKPLPKIPSFSERRAPLLNVLARSASSYARAPQEFRGASVATGSAGQGRNARAGTTVPRYSSRPRRWAISARWTDAGSRVAGTGDADEKLVLLCRRRGNSHRRWGL